MCVIDCVVWRLDEVLVSSDHDIFSRRLCRFGPCCCYGSLNSWHLATSLSSTISNIIINTTLIG